ncbi:thioredoxin domain-containing protein [Miltoncostaea marina]|uniref:thioredoxin domain-containing protein n=1 Tax=Miltoncostaea marina TaxID=2843215 RepID=UPI001C3D7508|nr:thioredoxin domain-containing protein [Miltoncostaea marina]
MNRLAGESSLYLRQHADNPVDWYPWGEEALARARDEDRPILLSVGYSSCHWCHVMAHESFEDEATAATMNELFVNVKVDREERPDVDALYMQATVALTGQGGWPMTVFLTPDGRPFYAGTYFPRTPRGGLPGFADLCRALAAAYRDRRDDVEAQAREVAGRLTAMAARRASAEPLDRQVIADAMVGLARQFDPADGGFGGAPKFPPSLALEFLLRRLWARPGDHNAREMAWLTLARMAAGGMYDQVGGGFHRYSVDGHWLVPHFEKMLYDNALLAADYALAYRVGGEPDHRRVAQETLDYLLREMRLPGGAFAAAQDADSPGGEGAFFVWTPEELERLLPPAQARAVTLRYGVRPEGNFEGRSLLHVAAPLEAVSQELGEDAGPLLEAARAALYAARAERPAPARDDKVLAAWNGLAIAALADAGTTLGRPDYLDAATAAAAFVLGEMVVDGRLRRVHTGAEAVHLGQLDDHADLSHGLLRLYEATFEPRWLLAARELAARMVELFADPERGGFFYTGTDAERLVARTREVEDHPTPSGNSQAARVLLRLADLTGDAELEELALGALRLVRAEMARFPQAFGAALVALDHHLAERREIAVAGPRDDPRTADLVRAAREAAGPHDAIAAGDPADAAATVAAPLLADRPLVGGAPAAYVCRRFACLAPVTDPDALRAALAEGAAG